MSVDEQGLAQVRYEETEHHVLTRKFMNDHRRMIRDLLALDE
jgi:predicted ATPase